jgi:aspartyl-tRNA(Asn)/glutamyl-tRNA(Gln) amidotransferase subunit A
MNTAFAIAARVRSGEQSAVDVLESTLDRIAETDNTIRAFLSVDDEGARRQAEAIDANPVKGPLAGVPVAIKDNIHVAGQITTCGSRMLERYASPFSATAVTRLVDAGAVLVGKTNLDEFAMGSSCEHSAYFPTRNPWDPERVPGGSSGGSAAAVAAGMVPLALGSDTGGSIRQPAAFCGITGLKPSYGAVSRYGLVAFASSLDQIGPLARDARDAALCQSILQGTDPLDSTTSVDVPPLEIHDPPITLDGLRIGVVTDLPDEGLDDEVRHAVRRAADLLVSLGATVQEIQLPLQKFGIATYYVVAPCEASSNLARYDGVRFGHRAESAETLDELYRQSRSEGFGPEVRRRIMLGTYALSAGYGEAYYRKAQQVRELIREEFRSAFDQVDVIATPTSPTPAFTLGASLTPLEMYLNDIYTVSANLAGIPGISIPCGFSSEGLPIGLQLLGALGEDSRLLTIAHAFQQKTDFHRQAPPCRPFTSS